jgi:hypothetical protein
MAITFDGTNEGLSRTTSLHDYNAAYTVTCWFYKTTSAEDMLISMNDGTSDTDEIEIDASELWRVRARVGGTGTFVNDAVNISLDAWYFMGLVRSSTTDLTAWLYDTSGSEVSSPTATQDVTGRTAQTNFNIGHRQLSKDWTGRVHCIKIWTAALTEAELLLEQWRVRPARFSNLVGWYPINPGSATEHARDYFGGLNWTEDGTPTDADPPPTMWGMPLAQVGVTTGAASSTIPIFQHHRRMQGVFQ